MGRIVFDTATGINGWIADEDNSLARASSRLVYEVLPPTGGLSP